MGIDNMIDFGWRLKRLHLKLLIHEIAKGGT